LVGGKEGGPKKEKKTKKRQKDFENKRIE